MALTAALTLPLGLLLPCTPRCSVPQHVARRPPLMSEPAATASKALYWELETLLKDAEAGPRGGAARALRKQWLELSPAELVETSLILGASIGVDFDRGLRLLYIAEDELDAVVSARGYSALMRLCVGAEQHEECLRLLARARAQDVTDSPGVLLYAMESAGALGDWGAVARLSDEYEGCADGCGVGDASALQLEMIGSPEVLAEIYALTETAPSAETTGKSLVVATSGAQKLALRAHCKRGDVVRASRALEALRTQGVALDAASFNDLIELARQGGTRPVVDALRPGDLTRALGAALEERLLQLSRVPAMLANDELEIAVVGGAAVVLIALAGAAAVVFSPPAVDPLAGL